jgi:hypothetical protein
MPYNTLPLTKYYIVFGKQAFPWPLNRPRKVNEAQTGYMGSFWACVARRVVFAVALSATAFAMLFIEPVDLVSALLEARLAMRRIDTLHGHERTS